MRSLIILKGLVKRVKREWVKRERLDNYFIDIDTIRKMYATPDLVIPQIEILNKSFGNLVYQRLVEIVYTRMCKGCLIVIDSEGEAETIIETLAYIFGYTIFYVIQDTPQDYTTNYKAYKIPYYPLRRKTDLEKEVSSFNNQIPGGKVYKIKTYKDVLDYWNKKVKKEQTIQATQNDTIFHVSDLHSNLSLLNTIQDNLNLYRTVIFYGDYIDGPEELGSKRILDFICKNKSKNIIFLEGNHELRLRRYLGYLLLKGTGRKTYLQSYLFDNLPENFLETTALEFQDLTPGQAKSYLGLMNKKLKMFALIKIDGNYFICTHAGIRYKEELDPKFVGNVIYRNADINRVDKEFTDTNRRNNTYSIHAHCKYDDYNFFKYDKVINLDPKSECDLVYAEQNGKDWKIKTICKEELN